MMEGSRVHELPQYLKVRNVHFSSKAANYTVSLMTVTGFFLRQGPVTCFEPVNIGRLWIFISVCTLSGVEYSR